MKKKLDIKTWNSRPSLKQAAIAQRFVRRANVDDRGFNMTMFEEVERVFRHMGDAKVPDPSQATIDYFEGRIPLPEIARVAVPVTSIERPVKPLTGLAETVNVDDDEPEETERIELGTVAPEVTIEAGAEVEADVVEPDDEQSKFEAAADASLDEVIASEPDEADEEGEPNE
jgi:hypothetical protein